MPVWIFGWPLREEIAKVAKHRGLIDPDADDAMAISALVMDILNKPDTERVHCYLCRGDDDQYLPVIGIAKDRKPTVEEAVFVERRLPPPRTVFRIVRQLRTFEMPSWFRYEDNLGLPEGVEGPDPPQIRPDREYDTDDFYDDDEDYGTDYTTEAEDDEADSKRAHSPESAKSPRANQWVRRPVRRYHLFLSVTLHFSFFFLFFFQSSPVVYSRGDTVANDSEGSEESEEETTEYRQRHV